MAIAPKLGDQLATLLGRTLRKRRAGVRHSARSAPELRAPAEITLASPDLSHQGTIPQRNGDSELVRLLPGSLGRRGYHGPRPLPGHGEHRYGSICTL